MLQEKLKPKTSYGADGISTKLLKKDNRQNCRPHNIHYKLTFNTGIFSTDLKCAKGYPYSQNRGSLSTK